MTNESQKQIVSMVWSFLRQLTGWVLIVVGMVMAPLPIPVGLPMIAIGVVMVGRRNRVMRWIRVHIRLAIREWAAQDRPILSPFARWTLRQKRRFIQTWQAYQERAKHKREGKNRQIEEREQCEEAERHQQDHG